MQRICARSYREQTLMLHRGVWPSGGAIRTLDLASAIDLKCRHCDWGVGMIRVLLQQRWLEHAIPCERAIQRWFRAAGMSSPVQPVASPRRAHSPQVHLLASRCQVASGGSRWAGGELAECNR
ncbi:hypothetical protein [Leptothermofonsia sp. ETS-13]|uniref:hypothetical protein n=1 Tax=Leptothermofonsia sp. ETS-13 TaxID=3035696 RepID=UPI003BA31AF2